jgi:hypothetical protein
MYQKSIFGLLVLFSAVYTPPLAASVGELTEQQQEPKQKPPSKGRADAASMTGCIDQQDGKFVLVDDRSLSPIADLVAEGFPQEGFAKHVGNKVTVRGTVNSNGPRPLVNVRSVEKISDGCKSAQQ